MVTLINLFITSGSAQWALIAPVVVPMMIYVDVSPEVTQMLYRIGDSPSNIITPMSPYFALALTFLQKYYKKAGVGTLPYTVAILIGWFLFFLIWYYAGIPLGPGSPMGYELYELPLHDDRPPPDAHQNSAWGPFIPRAEPA